MESQFRKWVNLSYLALAVLVGYVVFAGAFQLVGVYDLEARVRNLDLVIRGLSALAGAVLFVALYRNRRANQFMDEVMLELSRVTWPTQKETSGATFIVVVMVLISGVILGLLDYLWTIVLKGIL